MAFVPCMPLPGRDNESLSAYASPLVGGGLPSGKLRSKDRLPWFRGSCGELSCQLPRTIMAAATEYRANCHACCPRLGEDSLEPCSRCGSGAVGLSLWAVREVSCPQLPSADTLIAIVCFQGNCIFVLDSCQASRFRLSENVCRVDGIQ